ncbi:PKD domain-containing protein [Agarivorans sp. B2Z047]|uniref:glycoside hydrolase family 48 protein n=1 Tax=Agarivorans sp. B2Z047 TaxID=2652721 RepID=UPI00128E92D7|nr:glycoside hydrolase family 48 protein [Agarivorans sp. B2Z047]MPW29044.1 PKD domain-containing protein [Agarivorans sp. B2Z047]UQN41597.1 PKD domain-containing protein [Agarivorans sp. B2Z047]
MQFAKRLGSNHLRGSNQATGLIRRSKLTAAIVSALVGVSFSGIANASEYEDRFAEIRGEIYAPENGYLSADGGPYHSIETFIIEAPDHGHESTSEAYSYILWLEAVHGKLTGDWQPLIDAWALIEDHIIPTSEMQPTADKYANAKATYVPEGPLPSSYPLPLTNGAAVGEDPISADLASTYGTWDVYGMHWLLDMDNVYQYGNLGDGTSTPSYINTFQRGEQESVWETVPHPSWEDFSWGGEYGFLDLFVKESQAPAKQWRYTNAPDADARAVQVMYWALQWMKERGQDPEVVAPGLMAKAAKMGDYLRLAMFDKYFKKIGSQDAQGSAGQGYDSAHYLMSWYYSWGGPIDPSANWAWRIGSSHVHFAYQNPMAAYALSQIAELQPKAPNSVRDWDIGLERSLEFFQWTQSAEGAFSGGATNSWNGKYDTYPADRANNTFYGLAYDENPVYEDPGSGTWFGWQTWGVERVAEYYFITGEARAKAILDKWISWVLNATPEKGLPVLDFSDNDVKLAATLAFTGVPEKWDPANPKANTNLHVEVIDHGQDVGVAHNLAKTLMYYAAAEQKHQGEVHQGAKDAAQMILDRFWANHRTDKGVSAPETRSDYAERINEPVFFPAGWSGKNAVGADLNADTTFSSMRPFYNESDPGYQELQNALAEGRDPTYTYHRYWAQVDVATANALYAELFPEADCADGCSPSAKDIAVKTSVNTATSITLEGSDNNGTVESYNYSQASNGTVSGTGKQVTYTPQNGFVGVDSFTYTVTDNEQLSSAPATVTITVEDLNSNLPPEACFTATPTSAMVGDIISFDASCATDTDGDTLSYSWAFGDNSNGSGASIKHSYAAAGSYDAVLTVNDGKGGVDTSNVTITIEEPAGNLPPEACFTATPTSANVGDAISFNANCSNDADGDNLSYSWAFGDNSNGSGASTQHSYSQAGSYNAVLTVDDGKGGVDTSSTTITISEAPVSSASCKYEVQNHWNAGFVATITITNNGNEVIDGWDVNWNYADGSVMSNGWNANFSGSNPYSASSLSWNSRIQPGQSVSFGLQGNKAVFNGPAPVATVTGAVCN